MVINDKANKIIELLQTAGYKAYLVGGCVRDAYMGIPPKDWDICTSATPEEMREVFKDYKIYNTGEKHGTLTVNVNDELFEVTTFRKDGRYTDARHPDSVEFIDDIKDDLARRDFTINAIAYNYQESHIDPFGGCKDIRNNIIRCVGNPEERFKEDALRILRALRFAARYGLKIEDKTLSAMYNLTLSGALHKIAKERIREELIKIIDAPYAYNILHQYYGIICNVIPYLGDCVGFNQNNKYHEFDVYEHSLQALKNYISVSGDDTNIKIALLLHDIGKPECYTEDENGGHFHGHPAISKKRAEYVLNTLRFSNMDKADILMLVENHDIHIEATKRCVHKAVCKFGPENLGRIFQMQKADILAHSPLNRDARYEKIIIKEGFLREIIDEDACFSLKDLAINGTDIINTGIPQGKMVGETLDFLLRAVMDGCSNDRRTLLKLTEEYKEYIHSPKYVNTGEGAK